MLWNNVFYKNVSASSCCCNHKCTRFDLIRNYRISSTSQIVNAPDFNYISSGAHDVCSHWVQEISKIDNMRFFCCVFNDAQSLCFYSGKHCVHCCAYRNNVQIDLISSKTVGSYVDHTVIKIAIRTQCGKCFQMLIDRTISQRTSSRHWNSRLIEFSQQRSEKIIRSSHLSCTFIRHTEIIDPACVDSECVSADGLYLCAHFIKNSQTYWNVAYIRYIFKNTRFIGQYYSRYNSNGSVFSSADFDFAMQTATALNNKFFQDFLSLRYPCRRIPSSFSSPFLL